MAIFGFIILVLFAFYMTCVSAIMAVAVFVEFSTKREFFFAIVPTIGLWYAVAHFNPFTLVVS